MPSSTAISRSLDIPIDMSRDVNSGDTFLVPGDSIAVKAHALIPGTAVQDLRMIWALKTNPLFEDALRSAPTGVLHENVIAGPAGTVWSGEVVADSSTWSTGEIAEDHYFFDLPDVDFMYPGDVLQYYFRATDTDGRVSTLPSDMSAFGAFDDIYPAAWTVSGLPSISDDSGTQPSILVLNDVGNDNGFHPVTRSLNDLGLAKHADFDVYKKLCVGCRPNSSGIGSACTMAAAMRVIRRRCRRR